MDEYKDKFNVISILGEGSYGEVALVQSKKNRDFFAAKVIDINKVHYTSNKPKSIIKQNIQKEINILQKLSDIDGIVKFYSVFIDDIYFIIIMEYIDGLDMFEYKQDFLRNNDSLNSIPSDLIIHYMKIFCSAMIEVHNRGIIHSDIKSENTIITGKKLSIVDFGLSCIPGPIPCDPSHGTLVFLSPEKLDAFINHKTLTIEEYKASDVWAFGVTFFTFIHIQNEIVDVKEKNDFEDLLQQLYESLQNMTLNFTYNDGNEKNVEIIKKVLIVSLDKDPKTRPTFAQILKFLQTSSNEK